MAAGAGKVVATTDRARDWLLSCGILAALLYVAMTLSVGRLWEGYSAAAQMISELSAIDAPTRPLWMLLGTVYSLLMIAFGWGIWKSSPRRRTRRALGMLLMIHGCLAATGLRCTSARCRQRAAGRSPIRCTSSGRS